VAGDQAGKLELACAVEGQDDLADLAGRYLRHVRLVMLHGRKGVTHDYKRHGKTTLFAPLNVLNGAVLATCKPRHRHQEFLAFLREIDKAVSAELDVHCIADNYATYNHPKIKAWLAARPRWRMHFILTYSSWLNQVERFTQTTLLAVVEAMVRRLNPALSRPQVA